MGVKKSYSAYNSYNSYNTYKILAKLILTLSFLLFSPFPLLFPFYPPFFWWLPITLIT